MAAAPPVPAGSPTVTQQKPGPADVFRTLGSYNLYNQCRERGMTLSAMLERLHPEPDYKDGLDAFSRLMMTASIVAQSDAHGGYIADEMDAFDRDENTRALFPEWGWRQWRKATQAVRAPLLTSADFGVGTINRPYFEQPTPRALQLAPAIPLSEVVAFTTPTDSDDYRAFYLTHTAAQMRLVRVGEGAELPRATVTGAPRTNNLLKYGRALEITYEFVRRRRIDLVAFWIQRLAVQTEIDKVSHAIDVAINGDGNSGTAATNHNLSTLDANATLGELSLEGWLNFKLQFVNPYQLTHVFARSTEALQLYTMSMGTANVPLVTIQAQAGFGSLTPINRELADNVRIGITTDAPANVIVGMDARFGIEQAVEIGSQIQEQMQWILRQVNILTFSEGMTFVIADTSSVRTLTINA